MARDKRNIDVAGFANGLAVIERFKNGKAAGMFLDLARESVKIASSGVIRERLPRGKRGASRFHGGVDIAGGALSDVSQFFGGGRIGGVEIFCMKRSLPRAVDEMTEAAFMAIEPGQGFAGIFRRGAVVHGDEFFDNAHLFGLMRWDGDNPPSTGR